ncbi:hypothetical protein ACWJJH_09335 [Endozoicomonadaceae bacterium StTr2]
MRLNLVEQLCLLGVHKFCFTRRATYSGWIGCYEAGCEQLWSKKPEVMYQPNDTQALDGNHASVRISILCKDQTVLGCCWILVLALLLVRCGHCRIIEEKDLDVAEALNREWHISQEPIIRALIRDFSRWELGIDILTGQPVREVHLRAEIRNKLIQATDLE